MVLFFLFFLYCLLSFREIPKDITYGVSFSKLHADELSLPWREVYKALIDDLEVRNFRLSAHWPMVEPKRDSYDFEAMDFQIKESQREKAEVILAVGRRLPGWPECHIPDWAKELSWEEQKEEVMEYVEVMIERYKNYENIKYWQVENEPFLEVFAKDHCGEFDE
ncbi:MAG: endo-1,4-beta-xylanase, partial [Patescibacteria group bacterium]